MVGKVIPKLSKGQQHQMFPPSLSGIMLTHTFIFPKGLYVFRHKTYYMRNSSYILNEWNKIIHLQNVSTQIFLCSARQQNCSQTIQFPCSWSSWNMFFEFSVFALQLQRPTGQSKNRQKMHNVDKQVPYLKLLIINKINTTTIMIIMPPFIITVIIIIAILIINIIMWINYFYTWK